ncbi:grasp-with-spasm system SPASM domain peptide maturase [Pedobacter panaciterrae]
MKEYLLLYSNCILTKGNRRSAICDLQREKLVFIPNSLADLFTDNGYIIVNEVLGKLDSDDIPTFKEYVDYLIREKVGFFVNKDELPLFPIMNKEWLFPAEISNCIIDSNGDISYINDLFLADLALVCCNYLQFRFFQPVDVVHLESLMQIISPSQIKSVEILIPDIKLQGFVEDLIDLSNAYAKIQTLIVHSSDQNQLLKEPDFYGFGKIISSTERINSQLHCGIVDHNFFSINVNHYTESLNHNTCLNRKVSIDVDGNIKNCPSMKETFGNLKEVKISEAIKSKDFKKYWNITKDQILTCKDCEFRNVCTDCRAYVEQPENDFSKPLKCGYDPYTCQWEEWSDNALKQHAIAYYNMQPLLQK